MGAGSGLGAAALNQISPVQKSYANIGEHRIAYVEAGQGRTVVLLHGNPTSSYLWRLVTPALGHLRTVTPDLLGMGDSSRLPTVGPSSYRFFEHFAVVEQFLNSVAGGEPVDLVLHDWGSALGFHYAHLHPERVRSLSYMEALVCPLTWDDWPEGGRNIFRGFRSERGEELVLERNLFLEAVLPGSILRTLAAEELDEYRRPFLKPGEDRRPMLTWPRELPIDGEPADVCAAVAAYGRFLSNSDLPKLFINADPGSILVGRPREYCRGFPNQKEVTVRGLHFIQEDSGAEIGQAIADFLANC